MTYSRLYLFRKFIKTEIRSVNQNGMLTLTCFRSMRMFLFIFTLMLWTFAVDGEYHVELKVVDFQCNTKQCKHMKICYSYEKFCNEGRLCLQSYPYNEEEINITSAMNGHTKFNEFAVHKDMQDSPKIFYVILNQQDKKEKYCEESRNKSGNTLFVHLKKVLKEGYGDSFINIELQSVCNTNCTGTYCQRCYNTPPIVNISVNESVAINNTVTLTCGISPMTKDTKILWFMRNGTFSKTIHNSGKYKVTTSMSMNSSFLTLYSVQLEDELNYTCQATNVIQKAESNPMQLVVFEYPIAKVSNISPAKAGTNITIRCDVPSSSKATGVTWRKNDSIINITNNDKYGGGTLSSPSLEIFFVQMVDEGNYTCQATNPIGTGSQTVFLAVFSDPPVVSLSKIKPAVTGTNITLICNITSLSEVIYVTWFKNNVSLNITHTDKKHLIGGSVLFPTLTITSLEIEDEGDYICQAVNVAGEQSSEPVHLHVFEIQSISALHTSGIPSTYIFSSFPSYLTDISTRKPIESSKTTCLSSYESSETTSHYRIIPQSSIKISSIHLTVPTSSVKHIKPTNSVRTSATTLIDIHPTAIVTPQANSDIDNRTNVNAWIIMTVVICIVELIVLILVVYIVWLKKKQKFNREIERKRIEQERAMDNVTYRGTPSCIMDNGTYRGTESFVMEDGTYRGTPSILMDNGTWRTQRSSFPKYATMGRYPRTIIVTDNLRTEPRFETEHPTAEDYHYTEINKVRRDNIPVISNRDPTSEEYHYTEINKVPRDNIPVIPNGVIHSEQTAVLSNETPISDRKQQTEKDKIHSEQTTVISNETPISDRKQQTEKDKIHSDQTTVISNETPISDRKQQTEKDKASRDESPDFPNRLLLKEPSDETVNETEVTSF